MKPRLLAILTILSISIAFTQNHARLWELSLSANLGSATISTETKGPSGFSLSETETQKYFSLAFRPGYRVWGGLEIEPEIYWTAIEQMSPAFILSVNVAYNVAMYTSDTDLFLLAGYGIGNAFPVFQGVVIRISDRFDIPMMNLGGGLKFLVTDRVALRAEYRYQHFKYDETDDAGYFKTTRNRSSHNLLFGFSVFFP